MKSPLVPLNQLFVLLHCSITVLCEQSELPHNLILQFHQLFILLLLFLPCFFHSTLRLIQLPLQSLQFRLQTLRFHSLNLPHKLINALHSLQHIHCSITKVLILQNVQHNTSQRCPLPRTNNHQLLPHRQTRLPHTLHLISQFTHLGV